MFLMAHEGDGFTRSDAAQTLAQRLLLRMVAAPDTPVPTGFLAAFRGALRAGPALPPAEPALLAEVLSMPSEGYLGDQMGQVDVEGIHQARETLRRAISLELHSDLSWAYEATRMPAPTS